MHTAKIFGPQVHLGWRNH